jgi:hypothetical protein
MRVNYLTHFVMRCLILYMLSVCMYVCSVHVCLHTFHVRPCCKEIQCLHRWYKIDSLRLMLILFSPTMWRCYRTLWTYCLTPLTASPLMLAGGSVLALFYVVGWLAETADSPRLANNSSGNWAFYACQGAWRGGDQVTLMLLCQGLVSDTSCSCAVWGRKWHCGHSVYRQFNIRQFSVLRTLYLCVLCGSQNKQRLFPYAALTDWIL